MTRHCIFFILLLASAPCWAHVNLTYPEGGEVFHPGEVITISWELAVQHDQKNWHLKLSTDGGNTWTTIADNLPVSQLELEWPVPNIEVSDARIKVIQDNNGGNYSAESGNFVITSGSSEGAMLTAGASEVTFGYLEPMHNSTESITLMNTGTADLTITDISGLTAPFFITHPALPFDIPADNELQVELTFSPDKTGSFSQKLVVNSNAPNGTVEITVQGESITLQKAEATVCYAVTGINDGGRLLEVSLSDGSASLVTDMEGLDLSTAVAVNTDGFLFSINAEHQELIKVDAEDGRAIKVMDTELSDVAMDFGSDDLLYVVGTESTGDRNLFTIDVQAKNIQTLGPVDVRLTGISRDPLTDMIYGVDASGELYTLDKTDGAVSPIGSIGVENVTDIAFDMDGALYAVAGGGKSSDNELLTIDKTNGSLLAIIGNTGFTAISGMTISPGTIINNPLSVDATNINLFPNPFTSQLSMNFGGTIPDRVDIYTISGALINTFHPNKPTFIWNAKDQHDHPINNGVYLLRITLDDKEIIRKVVKTTK